MQGVLASLLAKKLAVAVRPGLSDPPCVASICGAICGTRSTSQQLLILYFFLYFHISRPTYNFQLNIDPKQ